MKLQSVNTVAVKNPPKWRLHIMRALFFLNFISVGFDNWSKVLFPEEQLDLMTGVAVSFWAGFALLNLIGVRFPLKMLPILMLQLLYKSGWILGTYLPAKSSGLLDAGLKEFFWICIAGIVLNLFIIPWGYVYREYLKNFFNFKK
ncbi:MAG: hypothetical protein COA50_05955 [Flavobacteriaceae bacterium]|nr:MAG: hypothetical protein COA50_05955 [Flavobacteriaceae bacterium]